MGKTLLLAEGQIEKCCIILSTHVNYKNRLAQMSSATHREGSLSVINVICLMSIHMQYFYKLGIVE